MKKLGIRIIAQTERLDGIAQSLPCIFTGAKIGLSKMAEALCALSTAMTLGDYYANLFKCAADKIAEDCRKERLRIAELFSNPG